MGSLRQLQAQATCGVTTAQGGLILENIGLNKPQAGNAIYGYEQGLLYKVVVKYDRYLRTWKEIGTEYDWYHSIGNFTASETLIGGGSKLYQAIDSNNAILEYSTYRKDWHKISGPGSMWQVSV